MKTNFLQNEKLRCYHEIYTSKSNEGVGCAIIEKENTSPPSMTIFSAEAYSNEQNNL